MTREVLHNVQVARFLAAACILVTHTAGLVLPPAAPILRFPWWFGVDIFFVISGFIMAWLMHDRFGRPGVARDFLLRRLIRIVPSYWVFTSLMVATALLLREQVRYTTVDGPQLVTSYAFLPWPRPADGQLNPILSQGWTLNYEMFFYAAFAASLAIRRGLAVLAAAFAALAALHPLIPAGWFMPRFWSESIILEFLAGIGLAGLYRRGWRLAAWQSLILASGAILLLLAPPPIEFGAFDHLMRLGLPGILVGTALILRPEPDEVGALGRLLRAGGDGSYALYLSHTFTVNAVVLLWAKAGLTMPWLAIAVAMSAAIGAAILFYRLVERPLIEALQRLLRTRPVRGAATVAP